MKKILLLCLIIFVFGIVNVNAASYLGDIDGNGKLGSNDYLLIRKHLLGVSTLSADGMKIGDVNKDNKISSADYILIRKMIINGEALIPMTTPTPTPTPVPEYTVKYYQTGVVETGLNNLIISGAIDIPHIESNYLKLAINATYVVSFDYKTDAGTNKFNIDLYPDSLPEVILTATTTNQHYDWEVSSSSADMGNCQLRFFDNQQEANEKDIKISNIIMGTMKKENKKKDSTLGTLPTPTRSGYKFLGWYTSPTGGNQVSANTKVTNDMTLYSHWELEKTAYDITADTKFDKYKTVASCSSTTFKYRIIENSNQDYVLIWVSNPTTQLNNVLASYNGDISMSADTMLANEISTYGYGDKCMIATNASFFDMSTGNINGNVILSKGRIVRNNSGGAIGIVGVDGNGLLREFASTNSANDLSNAGVRSTFVISGQTHNDHSQVQANRTQICQIDRNNFAMLSGSGTVYGAGEELKKTTGCTTVFNLDGGGSRKLYYKIKDSSALTRRFGGGREVPDMLYFVE